MKGNKERRGRVRLVSASMLFLASAFLLITFKSSPPDWNALLLAAAVPLVLWLGVMALPKIIPGDRLLLSLTNFLCALGILVLYSVSPAKGLQQAIYYLAGLPTLCAAAIFIRKVRFGWRWIVWCLIPLSWALLALPLAIGRQINGARSWINIGGISVQPSEFVKLMLLVSLAYCMAKRRMASWLILSFGCLGLLMLQQDLGAALLYYVTALLMFYISSGNLPLTGLGVLGGAGAAAAGYQMYAHVRRRVMVWQNPWRYRKDEGYQIVQSLVAIASGGFFGVGLGLGAPTVIPVYESDMIFAVICEQFGILFGLCVLAMYGALILRGAAIAAQARKRFHALLAMGCVILLGIQTFVIVGGVMKLIPLTGVTMPFISAGGSSLISSLCLVGILQGVAGLNEDDLKEDARLARFGSPEAQEET
ncbi:MAG: FtsW/RodA/SpoVE family cell cycle protein [Clostridia bacterium]|nr:FtsW/RodA/SpoVE family cell cycle protein [Clostridia bacterium]